MYVPIQTCDNLAAGAARLYEQVARDLENQNPDGAAATIDKFLKT